jgi:iron complex outermembrane receptor protein
LGTTLALDVRGIGERRSLDGAPVRGFVVANATATTSAMKRLDLQVSLYNIFNTRYADPAAKEHVQRSIEQDGRTFRVRVIARF